jgi:hypothetical protein
MAFKLAVAAVLIATINFTMNDGGQKKEFKFSLKMDRLSEADWNARIKNDQGVVDQASIKKTLAEITTGWQDQTLVLDDATNQPADFCPDALAVLLDTPGLTDVVLGAYVKEVAAKVKN